MKRQSTTRPGKQSGFAILLTLIVGAAIGGCGVYFGAPYLMRHIAEGPKDDRPPAPEVLKRVVASGRIEPLAGVINLAGPMGDRIGEIKVDEGQEVEEKQLLIELDSYFDRKLEVALLDQQIRDADQRLKEADEAAQAQTREFDERIRQLREITPLDIQAQEQKIKYLKEQVEKARSQRDRMIAVRPPLSAQERDQQQLLVLQAEEEFSAAEMLLEKAKKGLIVNLEIAKAQREAAIATNKRLRGEISIEALKKQRVLAESRTERSVIKAPSKGVVLRRMAKKGEATTGQPLLQIADLTQMVVIAEVYETRIGLVREWGIGSPAQINSRALANPLNGTVHRIGSIIARNTMLDLDPTADVRDRVVEVIIKLEDSTEARKFINLQVTVEIKPK
jgi:HlyD family secretion protein